ncbi:hypothetical protein JHK87_040137 [Glycine soja]|nr:hypothetical protein JHK87_040137 [Glycine soja]
MPSFSMLHHTPIMVEAMRRYHDFWMSLIADLMLPNSSPPTIFPPLDIHWVWFCHTLNLVSYREYCETRFSKLIGKAGNFDEENREYALMWCREIWSSRYPLESFETRRVRILYCEDLKALAIEGDLEKVATLSEKVKEKEFEETKKLWDRVFNQPYEIDGGEVPLMLEDVISIKSPIYWEDSGTDGIQNENKNSKKSLKGRPVNVTELDTTLTHGKDIDSGFGYLIQLSVNEVSKGKYSAEWLFKHE